MENEIKVNEYIRTKRGIIDKAVKILDDYIFLESKFFITEYGESFTFIKKTDVVKHSPNLIDLIQCGDYVNREKVEKIAEPSLANDYNRLIYCNECEGLYKLILFNKDIKEIVTKEMMESISYKVTKM